MALIYGLLVALLIVMVFVVPFKPRRKREPWTEIHALEVLAAGDELLVQHKNFPGETFVVADAREGRFWACRQTRTGIIEGDPYTEETGVKVGSVDVDYDHPVGKWAWGEFEVVGFNWFTEKDEAGDDDNRQELIAARQRQMGG